LYDMTCRSERKMRRRGNETEVSCSIRRTESEIAKDRTSRSVRGAAQIIDYKSKTGLYRTTQRAAVAGKRSEG